MYTYMYMYVSLYNYIAFCVGLLIMNVMMMIAQGLGILIGRKIGLIVRLSITAAIHNKVSCTA